MDVKNCFKCINATVIFSIFIYQSLYSQAVDYNTIILPQTIKNISIEERLIQIAWQNSPQTNILENQVDMARKNITVNQADWLNIIRISGNLNEYTLNPDKFADQVGNRFYPRYNFGATFTLGIFAATPAKVKIARYEYENRQEDIKREKLLLRAEVLRRYYLFRQNEELYKIQNQLTEDSYSTYQIAEQQFKNGEILLEEYNQLFTKYFNEKSNEIKLKTQFELSKVDLEELIGVALDDILK